MLTCWSDSTRVTSESSRDRSSASTWIATRNTDDADGAHSTSTIRSGWPARASRVDAVLAVHRDAAAPGDEADDAVARHRRAAAGQLDPDVRRALDDDAGVAWTSAAGGCVTPGVVTSARSSVAPSSPPSDSTSRADDRLRRHVAVADRGVQRGDVRVAQLVGERRQRLGGEQPLHREVLLAHRLGDRVLALLDRLLAALLGEPGADLVAGPRALDEGQPVAAGPGALRLGGEDLDQVAVVERALQRHQPAVDPRADACGGRPRCARRRRSRPASRRPAAR